MHRNNVLKKLQVVGLECTVSLLSCFELALGWEDWVVGQHGLIIQFREPTDQRGNPDEPQGCMRSATFLPEVRRPVLTLNDGCGSLYLAFMFSRNWWSIALFDYLS